MPKRRRDCYTSFDGSRLSPFSYNSRCLKTSLPKNPLEDDKYAKEWEEARCPVCMEHPHNAVILMCSSHDKGCRPFMCDTSHRHSNCLDQFRKSSMGASSTTPDQDDVSPLVTSYLPPSVSVSSSEATSSDGHVAGSLDVEGSTSIEASIEAESCEDKLKSKLVCPLCRGHVNGWVVVESARKFMNAIPRSCACETCEYSGTYTDLRKHARQVHPLVRPTVADPERQRNWRRLERQRDLGDLISTLQTTLQEGDEDSTSTFDEGGWLTVFFLVRILRPGSSSSNNGSWSVASRTRQAQVTIRRRPSRRLWGETYDWEADSRDMNNEAPDGVADPPDES